MTPSDTINDGDAEERRAMLEAVYRAFNERDIDAFLGHLAPGANWPDASGRQLRGRNELRAYWQKHWKEIDLRVEPMRINFAPDGTAHVLVDQLARSLDGKILHNWQVEHIIEFDGPFISRLTIVGLPHNEPDHTHDDDDGDGDGGEGGESGEAGE